MSVDLARGLWDFSMDLVKQATDDSSCLVNLVSKYEGLKPFSLM